MAQCETAVINHINALLPDTYQAVCDAVILSVLCMATNRYDGVEYQDIKPIFQAPLRSLQWLDVYGRLSPNPVHQAGLLQLVYLRGGLEKIEIPGLAAVISFSSVLGASKALSRPHFPFISLKTGRQMALRDLLQNQPQPIELSPLLGVCMTSEMYDVFRGAHVYQTLVNRYEDSVQDVDRAMMCDTRNLVQWHIMSLLPAGQLGTVLLDFCPVYETCRLALMIFGVGVIFPLPTDVAPLSRLSRLMQLELQMLQLDVALEHEGFIQAQCWCLVLGAIAAAPSERTWYIQEVRKIKSILGLSTWSQLKMLLTKFLWWEKSCDRACRQLWDEVTLTC